MVPAPVYPVSGIFAAGRLFAVMSGLPPAAALDSGEALPGLRQCDAERRRHLFFLSSASAMVSQTFQCGVLYYGNTKNAAFI